MVYDRRFGDRELNFEASGALWNATLVMRDRETDSWWSIMSSDAIGGELEGSELVELPVSEKTTWSDWVERHPDTLVLSVDGIEHIRENPYQDYFTSDRTFRELKVQDKRLEAKEPIYSFWLDGRPHAVAHRDFAGGRLLLLDDGSGRALLLHRPQGASVFASSEGHLLGAGSVDEGAGPRALLERIAEGALDAAPLEGFDTYWYSWISVNPDSRLITP